MVSSSVFTSGYVNMETIFFNIHQTSDENKEKYQFWDH